MGYRDELEATRARADQLEVELATTRSEIDRLRGGPRVEERAERNVFFGGPTRLHLAAEVEGEIGEDGYELIVSALREELGSVGSVDRVGRSLAWRSTDPRQNARQLEAIIEVRDGRTRIRLRESLSALAGSVFGGFGGGVGLGMLGGIIPISMAAGLPNMLIPVVGAMWLGGVLGSVRTWYSRTTRRREDQLGELIGRLEAVARDDIGRAVTRARVEAERLDEDEHVPEEEVEEERVSARHRRGVARGLEP